MRRREAGALSDAAACAWAAAGARARVPGSGGAVRAGRIRGFGVGGETGGGW